MNWLRSFLSNDSVFGRIMWRCGIIIGANLLFIVLSIPIVTIGAAYTAMHYTMLKTLRGNGQIQLFPTFWAGLRQNWKQATIAWLILLVILAVLGLELFWCSQFAGPVRYFGYGLMALMFIAIVVALYLFPTMAAFEATLKQLVMDSIYFAIRRPHYLILILFVNIFPLALTYTSIEFLPLAAFLWCMLGFGAIAMFTDNLLVKQFKPYLPEVDAAGDIIPEELLDDPDLVVSGAEDSMDERKTLKEIRKHGV